MTAAPSTVSEALTALGRRLAAAGIDTAMLDARLLVLEATGLAHEDLIARPDRPLSKSQAQSLAALAGRRAAREPLSRIVGEREFYGRPFILAPAALDPRPDTETLVERGLGFARQHTRDDLEILDLGTGSGAIVLTLLAELPSARGTGTDISPAAIEVARANAEALGVGDRAHFVHADWCRGIDGRFDLIVANPPYIPSGELCRLAPEVRDHDPAGALDGGADGLDAYRAIAAGAGRLLAPDGLVAVEIGAGQHTMVEAVFAAQGWRPAPDAPAWRDLAGRVRVLSFTST